MGYRQSKSADAGGSGTGTGLAFTANVASGSMLLFGARCGADNVVTVSDSRSNPGWLENVHQVQADDGGLLTIWSCPNAAAGATTILFNFGTAVTSRYGIAEYDGMLLSGVFDLANSSQSGSTPSATPTSGFITPSTLNSLIIGAVITGGSVGAITQGSGFTLREAANASNRFAFQDKIVTSATPVNTVFGFSPADTVAIAVLAYKMAASAPASYPVGTIDYF